ncbi:MAG: hypothetical protein ABIJ96_13450 [Elusimicrobiota bacterium]
MRRYALSMMCLVLAGGIMAGCGGAYKNTTSGKKQPEWIDRGGGAFNDEGDKRVLYGVGILSGVRNVGLARQAVDNRAIADIGKTIQVMSTQLMRDYASSINAGGEVSDEEQLIENSIKTFAQVSLSGVTIVNHWTDHETKTYYALAKLDMDAFKNLLEKSNKLSEDVKAHIRKNAEAAFDRMAQMEK